MEPLIRNENAYDAILIVSFGGPEKRDDVIPFLENVLRGKRVPRERMLEVAEHYYHFDGISPINEQCRQLISALQTELHSHDIDLPIYWGNRNWHPMLTDTMRQMSEDGVKRALAFVTSANSSYSGCRQYRENIQDAQAQVGEQAPTIDKLRVFYNHPDYVAASVDCVATALEQIPQDRRANARVAFTAHSIPTSMSDGCDYVQQLSETSRLIADATGVLPDNRDLVYQSRSGRPQDPWLEPDIVDYLKQTHASGATDVVVAPIGFLSDHMEVMFDLDHEAQDECQAMGLNMVRAATVGTHPRFIAMIRKLIEERIAGADKLAIGRFGPNHDACPEGCCPTPRRPPVPSNPSSDH